MTSIEEQWQCNPSQFPCSHFVVDFAVKQQSTIGATTMLISCQEHTVKFQEGLRQNFLLGHSWLWLTKITCYYNTEPNHSPGSHDDIIAESSWTEPHLAFSDRFDGGEECAERESNGTLKSLFFPRAHWGHPKWFTSVHLPHIHTWLNTSFGLNVDRKSCGTAQKTAGVAQNTVTCCTTVRGLPCPLAKHATSFSSLL